jgi:hypothetical protein
VANLTKRFVLGFDIHTRIAIGGLLRHGDEL